MKKLFLIGVILILSITQSFAQERILLTVGFDKYATRTDIKGEWGDWGDFKMSGGFISYDFLKFEVRIVSQAGNRIYEIVDFEQILDEPVGGQTWWYTLKNSNGNEFLAKFIVPNVEYDKFVFIIYYDSEHFYYQGRMLSKTIQ